MEITFQEEMNTPDLLAALPRSIKRLSFSVCTNQIRYILLELANPEILPDLIAAPKLEYNGGGLGCGCGECTGRYPQKRITRAIVDGALEGLRARNSLINVDAARAKYMHYVR